MSGTTGNANRTLAFGLTTVLAALLVAVQGSAVPGLAAMPNAWVSPHTPCGVRFEPSCAAPMPAEPTYAWIGPATSWW